MKKLRPRHRSSFITPTSHFQSGMTLVEVMIAFAILVAGLVAIFAMLNSAFRSHKRAINETESSMIAASVLAEMRAEFARGSVPPSDSPTAFKEYPTQPNYRVNRQVIPLDPARKGMIGAANLEYFVRVEVRWSEKGDNKSLATQTVMFRSLEKL